MRNGELGYWWRSLGGAKAVHAPLQGPAEADVAIVGGGFTGLWTALYLARADPRLRIVLLERETLGYGASGRNGGWVSGFFSGPARAYERGASGGRAPVRELQRAMFETVREIARMAAELGIDADLCHGGQLTVALGAAQRARLEQELAHARALGLGEQDVRLLSAAELRERVDVAGAEAASYTPHVARVHPAKLLAGLAAAAALAGVRIHERTPVEAISAHRAHTAAGAVNARWVIRATEGYTAELPGARRQLVPINSSMVVTEPLPERVWAQIGWRGCELLSDAAHVFVYLQRTADGRIAIGGRGVPYRYGSRTGGLGETAPATVASLRERLEAMFPAAAGAVIEHAWSGVLGVARDWCVSVQADATSGLASAGGYAGEGVAASNLAARILRDLVLGRDSELVRLPWVAHRARRWEPEPLRWCAIRGLYALYRRADAAEAARGRTSHLGGVLDAVSGRA
jgi:glycine/D-amino acid oxidase-like deaminating enzyme